MSETATQMNVDVTFSDAAAKKVKALIEEEKNPNLKLRIYISGGGCSGFQYGFSFDENVGEGDVTIEKDPTRDAGLRVLMGPFTVYNAENVEAASE